MTEETWKQNAACEDEIIVELELERLRPFKNHPFKVEDDAQMIMLKESIQKYGILQPLLVRPRDDGSYEIISGHRRRFAAQALNYRKVPVIIRTMSDDQAVISMVDSNLQREYLLPSDKAFAYKMKYEAMKRKAGRIGHHGDKTNAGRRTVEIVGAQVGESPKQFQRYMKLTDLVPELLKLVDDGDLGISPAVHLSYLKRQEQLQMADAMDYAQSAPSLAQAIRIRKLSEAGSLTNQVLKEMMSEVKSSDPDRVIFKNQQLRKYFPKRYTAGMMKKEIIRLLKEWNTKEFEKKEEDYV